MKLPSFKRLIKTDFQEEFQALVDTLSTSLNVGIESLYDAINRKLTLRDNVACVVKELDIAVTSTGIPKVSTAFPVDIPNRIDGLMVMNATNLTNPGTYPTSGVFISWSQTQTGILIKHITGLQADQTYRIRIVAFGQ